MTKKRLTPNQIEILGFCASHTFRDRSGSGYQSYDGRIMRTIRSLAKYDLVTEPMIYTAFSGAKITEKGWKALENRWFEP